MKKFIVTFSLSTSMVVIGFFSGGTIASKFFIKEGDGLASAASAGISAFAGAALGLVISVVLAVKLTEKQKMISATALTIISFALIGIFSSRFQ